MALLMAFRQNVSSCVTVEEIPEHDRCPWLWRMEFEKSRFYILLYFVQMSYTRGAVGPDGGVSGAVISTLFVP